MSVVRARSSVPRVDRTGRGECVHFQELNPAFEEVLGFTREELKAKPFVDFVHPDDRANTIAETTRLLEGHTSRRFKNRYRCKDGGYRWLVWQAAPVGERIYATAHDVTDLEEAQQRLNALNQLLESRVSERTDDAARAMQTAEQQRQQLALVTNAIPALISYMDRDLRYVFANATYERWFGVPRETVIGCTITEVLGEKGVAAIRPHLDRALAGEPDEFDLSMPYKLGSIRDIHVNYIPHFSSDGTVRGIVVLSQDVTDRNKQQAERARLIASAEAAEQASRLKSEFLANMSHEIRTPLASILGFADLLLEARLKDSDRLNYALTIRRNGEHLLELLNDILDLSKIEAGKLAVEHTTCAPVELLAEVTSLMRVRAIDKGLELSLEYATPIPRTINSDPTRLRQIVLNLVSNAVKFTDQGEVRIVARCEIAVPRLMIDVIDTGIGITPEQKERLFKPFAQADTSTTRRFGGSGLGLGISHALARALGGSLDSTSELGKGSTFTVSVPIALADLASTTDRAREALSDAPFTPAERPLHGRVLVAEDGYDNQVLVTALLRRAGLESVVVRDGRDAVDEALLADARGEPFDLILMDMQMPKLDGYAATAELRARGYTRPIVALTAHAMLAERQRCVSAGCDDYLTKPIDRDTFSATLRSFLKLAAIPTPQPRSGADAVSSTDDSPLLFSAFASDPDMRDVVGAFVAGLADQARALQKAAREAQNDTLKRLAHQLKGAGGGYGFQEVSEAAGLLESAVESGDESAFQPALAVLLDVLGRVREVPVPQTSAPPIATTPKVLVVDDSAQIHALVSARLRPEGVSVYGVQTADEAFTSLASTIPDLILLDLDLDGINGLDVCQRLKSDERLAQVPILILTGTGDTRVKVVAFEAGAVDYITKPFDAAELRARVRAALRTKRYHDLLSARAQVDGLTGLWNRRYFDARLREECEAVARYGRKLSLALIDVDHFKKLNDSFGHPFGDRVLQEISSALMATARASDVVCRYGGEELGVILRDTGSDEALRAAERFRASIAALNLVAPIGKVEVTASIGVAAIEGRRAAVAAQLLGAADEALYQAKNAGRNRVVARH